MNADHPDERAWEAFASGELDGEARQRLADHVVSCAQCREVFAAVRALMDGAPGVDPGAPVPAGERDSWRRHAPTLALAALALLAVAAALYLARPREEGGSVAAQAAPSGGTPPGVVAPAEPTPSYRLAMVKPDVQLPAGLVVATRGRAGADARQFLERFGEAITPYREGRFEDAVARLEALTDAHGDVAEVWFYLGVSRLLAGRPAEALAAFDHPGLADAFGDDLLWQRAVSLERLGRGTDADAALRALCARDGRYRERACAAAAGQQPGTPSRP